MNAQGGEGKGYVLPNLWLVLFSCLRGFKYIHTNIQQQCLNLFSIIRITGLMAELTSRTKTAIQTARSPGVRIRCLQRGFHHQATVAGILALGIKKNPKRVK